MNEPTRTGFPYQCVLITGASSGLGEEFAWQLAPQVGELVLVARRRAMLDELAWKIRAAHPEVAVVVFACDLNDPGARASLVAALAASGVVVDLLVNNAGLGDYGEFAGAEWEKVESMLRVNIEALTHLTHALLPPMVARRCGAILNVSSLASLLPIPDFAVYAATKAYVTSFSESLRIELRDHGIPVMALCPGPVKTGFGEVARREGPAPEGTFRKGFYVPKEQVVAEALDALMRGRARVYPGWKTLAAAVVISALPILLVRAAMGFRPRK